MIFLNVRTRFCCHIDLLTHREAVTGYPAGHRLASFYPLTWCLENLYLCYHYLNAITMDISEFILKFKTHPVLFIGAGISKRYCERAYSWDGLLETIALELSGDDCLYLELKNHAKESSGRCIFPKLATLLSAEIDNKLKVRVGPGSMLSDLEKNINAEFFAAVRLDQKASRLKIWVKILLSPLEVRAEKEDEITLFQEACKNIASIVTTNYDTFIEEKLKFSPLIGNDILLSNPYQSVYKIHGCLTNPSSIILTDEDYKQFDNRYELIQAELISLFIHNPIIFMGYGIQDENIQKLLSQIFSYVTPESELGKRVADNFLCVQFVEGSENTEVAREVFHIQQAGAQTDISLNVLKTDNFASLYNALAELQLPIEAIHLKRVASVFHEIKTGGEIAVKFADGVEELENRDLAYLIAPKSLPLVTLDRVYLPNRAIKYYFELTEQDNPGILIITDGIGKNRFFPAKGLSRAFPEMRRKDKLCRQQGERIKCAYSDIQAERRSACKCCTIDEINNDTSIAETYKWEAIFLGVCHGKIKLDDLRDYLLEELAKIAVSTSPVVDAEINIATPIAKLLCLYGEKKHSS